MPAVNATFNATSAVLLVLGLRAIKARQQDRHRGFMLAALCSSVLFLLGYITYHYVHGDTRYAGVGVMRLTSFNKKD